MLKLITKKTGRLICDTKRINNSTIIHIRHRLIRHRVTQRQVTQHRLIRHQAIQRQVIAHRLIRHRVIQRQVTQHLLPIRLIQTRKMERLICGIRKINNFTEIRIVIKKVVGT